MATDDGGATYPIPCHKCELEHDLYGGECGRADPGMTLLDHFAGLAMAVLVAQCRRSADAEDAAEAVMAAVSYSYDIAAAMVEEKRRLEKENTDGKK